MLIKRGMALTFLCMSFCIPATASAEKAKFSKEIWMSQKAVQRLPYDKELYTLAYNTFLANQNLKEATKIAEAAVKQRPNDMQWRRRLAIVARWNNHSELALSQWYYIAVHERSAEALEQAILLAEARRDDNRLLTLLKLKLEVMPNDMLMIQKMVALEERSGHPSRAIRLLEAHPTEDNLKELARLYQLVGHEHKEEQIIKKLSQNMKDKDWALMRQAEIYYNKGHISKAIALLKTADQPLVEMPKYWKTLAALAWIVNDKEMALQAYKKLFHMNAAQNDEMLRLVELSQVKEPGYAYNVALKSWNTYKVPFAFFKLLDLGSQLKLWNDLRDLYQSLSDQDRKLLVDQKYYWEMQPIVYENVGDLDQAKAIYQMTLQRFPSQVNFRLSAIWFLINHHYYADLYQLLQQSHSYFQHSAAFRSAYIYGLLSLGMKDNAVDLYSIDYKNKKHSFLWLSEFSKMLEVAGRNSLAFLMRDRAWSLINSVPTDKNAHFSREFAELALKKEPGETALAAIYRNEKYSKMNFDELLIAWALSADAYDLAHLVRDQFYPTPNASPSWADLTISLYDYDKYRLHHLLSTAPDRLPHRDRVSAAIAINDQPTAFQLAHEGLDLHQYDGLLDSQLQELMEEYANQFTTALEYRRLDNLIGPSSLSSLRYFITPRNALLLDSDLWLWRSRDEQSIHQLPRHSNNYGVGWLHTIEKGLIQWTVHRYQSLKKYFGTTVHAMLHLTNRWTVQSDFIWNSEIAETQLLRVGGVEDKIRLESVYRQNRHEQWISEVSIYTIRDQDRSKLANSYMLYAAWEEKIRATYPDLSIRLFGSVHSYHAISQMPVIFNGLLPFPAQSTNTVIPKSYNEFGISMQFGEYYRSHYTKKWRPFAMATIFRNSEFGIGYLGSLGLSGKVLGHDHLTLYYQRSVGQISQGEVNQMFGVSYSYYFTV